MLHSDDTAAASSAVKEQVRNFAERTDVLMAVLDEVEVAILHPFSCGKDNQGGGNTGVHLAGSRREGDHAYCSYGWIKQCAKLCDS